MSDVILKTSVRDVSAKTLRRKAKERFAIAKKYERQYLRSLRQVTRQVDHLVKGMIPETGFGQSHELQRALHQYSQVITPWARAVAGRMLWDIARKDEAAWIRLGDEIGRGLREELQDAPVGVFLNKMLEEQVHLITSLPTNAAKRVHLLTAEALTSGRRAADITNEILQTGDVTESRAKLIARTEVARTASGLTMARATHIGSTHYIWRTSRDSTVRESHKNMEGKVCAWDDPPEVEPGKHYHAGMFPNCRCFPEPIVGEYD